MSLWLAEFYPDNERAEYPDCADKLCTWGSSDLIFGVEDHSYRVRVFPVL